MMSDLLLSVGMSAVVAGTGFSARWLSSPAGRPHWSGWCALGCFTFATFTIVLGNLIR